MSLPTMLNTYTPSSAASSYTRRDQIRKDIGPDIFLVDANKNPMTAIMREAKGKKVKFKENIKYWFAEDVYVPNAIAVNGDHTSSVSTLTVDSGANDSVADGDILLYTAPDLAFETILVTDHDASSTTMTVSRGFGGTAQFIPDNGVLINLGNAAVDAGTTPDAVMTVPSEEYNFLQVVRTSIEETSFFKTAKKEYGDSSFLDKKRMFEHLRSLEMVFLLGQRASSTSSYLTRPTTGGFVWRMKNDAPSDNIWNIGGTFTLQEFYEHAIQPTQNYGSDNKLLMVSTPVFNQLTALVRGNVQYKVSDKVIGLKVAHLSDSILGNIPIINHPWMNQMVEPNADQKETVLKNWGVCVDMDAIDYCSGEVSVDTPAGQKIVRDTQLLDSHASSNKLAHTREWISVIGTEIKNLNAHSLFYGFDPS